MSQSAMSEARLLSAVAGGDDGEGRLGLRLAVLAGPHASVDADDLVMTGIWELLADQGMIETVLTGSGHVDARRRVLTGLVTVVAVLGLCLFRREGYDAVLRRVSTAVPWAVTGGRPPTGQALSKARTRVPAEVLQNLFQARAAGAAPPVTCGSTMWGLTVTSFDGTVFDLPRTAAVQAEFATPTGGGYPQARLVTLAACGTRQVLAAALDSAAVSEQALVDQLSGALLPGTLNLADRNFFSMSRWLGFAATGAHLAWRVKNGVKSLPARVIATLPDGSQLVKLRESDAMLSRRRRAGHDPATARLPDTIARLVSFTVTVTNAHDRGRTRTSRFQILTTLRDHTTYPATGIAGIYAERWQAEIVYHRIKVTLRGPGTRLRGQTPELARQEIWGLLIVYNTLCQLAVQTAVSLGVDPDEISFTVVLALTRTHLGADTACCNCGHRRTSSQDLLTAIAAHPRDRTNRQRASPRTQTQRRTEHTRDVAYTIEIVPSNLLKTDETSKV